MNKNRNLKVVIAIAIVLATLVSYLGWKNEHANRELKAAKNSIQLEIEKYNALQNEFYAMQNSFQLESKKVMELNTAIDNMAEELKVANTTIADLKNGEYELVYFGDFKITHYCSERYEHVCGYGHGLTATGTTVTPGRTIAVDPKVIPYGTEVYIEGYGWRVAEDCGGSVKGNHIDVAVDLHAEAMSMGIKYGGVWVLVKKSS